mmetsp:Transcript_48555/g.115410  ORF Transcript_48555/g.115410 Transcript_48555/m.115410 type:complete len:412 (+) Transcript_48555:122-1357(+)
MTRVQRPLPHLRVLFLSLAAACALGPCLVAGEEAADSDIKIDDVPAEEDVGTEVQERGEECPGYPSCAFAAAAGGSLERAMVMVRAATAEERKLQLEGSAMKLLPQVRSCTNPEDCPLATDSPASDDNWIAESPDGRGRLQVPASYQWKLENEPYLCIDSPDGDCSYGQNDQLQPEVDNRAILRANALDLHDMDLTGTIPAAGLAMVSDITSLDLSVNRLTGSIPDAIGLCTNLRRVKLSRNELQGWVPMAFGMLTELLYFDVSVNQISGSFPLIFGQMPNLITLNMGSNRLQGSLPHAMFSPWILMEELENHDYALSEIHRITNGGKEELLGLSHDGIQLLEGGESSTSSSETQADDAKAGAEQATDANGGSSGSISDTATADSEEPQAQEKECSDADSDGEGGCKSSET